MKVIKLKEKEKQKKELYEMLDKLPAPPAQANLSDSQIFWWYWIGEVLVDTKNFAALDLMHLQRAAFWLDARCKAIEISNHKNAEAGPYQMPGSIQTYTTGATNISPYVTIIEKADRALSEISAHFGLSIRDRNKLAAPPAADPAQTDLFKDFLNQKTS